MEAFVVTAPLGFVTERTCPEYGHPVMFRHPQTGNTFTPLKIGEKLACIICLAQITSLQCNRQHLAFEVSHANA